MRRAGRTTGGHDGCRALLHRRVSTSLCFVTRHSSRSALLATLLALLAVFAMSAVAGWQGAAFHDDRTATASVDSHVGTAQDDPDTAVHFEAHAIGHGVAIPVHALPARRLPMARMAWASITPNAPQPFEPASLLRPPRG